MTWIEIEFMDFAKNLNDSTIFDRKLSTVSEIFFNKGSSKSAMSAMADFSKIGLMMGIVR